MATERPEKARWSVRPGQLVWKLSDRARQAREAEILDPMRALGRRGEDLAHRYLRSKGLTVISRNYRPRGGEAEVDIVARDGEITVFVEVKTRRSAEHGAPERAIGLEKQRHIVSAARAFARTADIGWDHVRFDVVSIVLTDPPSIMHEQDAFFSGRALPTEPSLASLP